MKKFGSIFIFFFSTLTHANSNKIDSIVEEFLEQTNIPSVCVSITTSDTILHKKAYGYKDLENKIPATTSTIYPVGSISKSFTAMLMGIYQEEGIIDFDDKIQNLIPYFTHNPEITIRDYLSHQSGYGVHDTLWINKRYSRSEMIKRLRHIPQVLSHRRAFNYQNIGYMVAAHALECVTGYSWEQMLKEKILKPLELQHTYTDIQEMFTLDDFSYGYSDHIHPNKRLDFVDPYTIAPAGGLCMNIDDLTKWAQCLLNKGNDLLYVNTFDELCSPQVVTDLKSVFQLEKYIQMEAYGLGFFILSYQGHKIIFHAGNIPGFSSLIAFLPEKNFGISIITNKDHTLSPFFIAISILEEYFELESLDSLNTYKGLREELKKGALAKKEYAYKNRKENTIAAHLLYEYTGKYSHPAYGDLEVSLVGDELKGTYNDLILPLEHWHHGVFSATNESTLVHCHGVKFKFSTNFEGDINGVDVLFVEDDGPIYFRKKINDKFSSDEYLNNLVGNYAAGLKYGNTQVIIEKSNNHIIAKVGGHSKFHLIPDKHLTFTVDPSQKGYEGYLVEFLNDEDCRKINGVQLIHPKGLIIHATKKS